MSYRLGVDVGGTFTDLIVIDEATGRAVRDKVPSTPHDPSEAVITGARQLCEKAGISAADLSLFLHGTTVATNAVLEHKIARVGLIVTRRLSPYPADRPLAGAGRPGGLDHLAQAHPDGAAGKPRSKPPSASAPTAQSCVRSTRRRCGRA